MIKRILQDLRNRKITVTEATERIRRIIEENEKEMINDLLRQMEGVHSEWHKEIVEEYIENI